MLSLLWLIDTILEIAKWLLIASAIFSWLIAFDVVNQRNRVVWQIGDFLHRATEPMLRPIRRILPQMGGLDLSPVVIILLIVFIQNLLVEYGFRAALGQ
jgi:YggT family protein